MAIETRLRLTSRDNYVVGEWASAARRYPVLNPATEENIGDAPDSSSQDMEHAIGAAREAFDSGPWPRMSRKERAGYIYAMARWIRDNEEDLIDLVVAEAGATVNLARAAQVGGVAAQMEYVADCAVAEGETIPMPPKLGMNVGNRMVVKEPVGVVGAITAWNFPFFLNGYKLAPALATGCTVVLKPSPLTPHSGLVFGMAAEAAGLPGGVLNVVTGSANALGEQLVGSDGVDMISFTGSGATGRAIQEASGSTLKRLALELGGKSAMIVLEDANPQLAGQIAVGAVCGHAGQVCVTQSRVLVPRSIYAEVLEAAKAAAAAVKVGDPRDPQMTFGPLVSAQHREKVEGYIKLGIEEGATLLVGGDRPAGMDKGYYLNLTVFSDVRNEMRIAREEIFGPVQCIIPYDGGDDEAVRLANDSPYGLSGAVWSGNVKPRSCRCPPDSDGQHQRERRRWPGRRGNHRHAHRRIQAEWPRPGAWALGAHRVRRTQSAELAKPLPAF